MKKALYATAGSALALVLFTASTVPASADVNVYATILKNKDITVTETIDINKTITFAVASVITPDAAAEAQALLNVTTAGYTVAGPQDQTGEEGGINTPANPNNVLDGITNFDLHLSAVMAGSASGNVGVWGFNQDVGNMSNQGNVVSIAGITDLPSFADAQAEADQSNHGNTVTDYEIAHNLAGDTIASLLPDNVPTDPNDFQVNKLASITNSINTNTGVMNVNQNAGNMNSQSNGVAAAVGLGALVAMSESALGQENFGNKVFEIETVKRDVIRQSINGNAGIVGVNQSTGNMNNQGNVVSLAATTSGAILTSP